jgi:hypothetical protein
MVSYEVPSLSPLISFDEPEGIGKGDSETTQRRELVVLAMTSLGYSSWREPGILSNVKRIGSNDKRTIIPQQKQGERER